MSTTHYQIQIEQRPKIDSYEHGFFIVVPMITVKYSDGNAQSTHGYKRGWCFCRNRSRGAGGGGDGSEGGETGTSGPAAGGGGAEGDSDDSVFQTVAAKLMSRDPRYESKPIVHLCMCSRHEVNVRSKPWHPASYNGPVPRAY